MALQIDCNSQGGVVVADAIHVITAIRLNIQKSVANIHLCVYKDVTEQTNENILLNASYTVNGSHFTTYFNTADGSKTVAQKAQDYLLAEESHFAGATVI